MDKLKRSIRLLLSKGYRFPDKYLLHVYGVNDTILQQYLNEKYIR